jgi:hypothetical protein
MTNAEKELAQIVQRNYSWLVSMAGLAAPRADDSLGRHSASAGALTKWNGYADSD